MDTKYVNKNIIPSGHQTTRQRYKKMENPMIGITIQVIVVTIAKNMGMFLRIAFKHILVVTTIDG